MSNKKTQRFPFEDPEFAAKAGRKGGLAKAAKERREGVDLSPFDLDTRDGIGRALAHLAVEVAAGRIPHQDCHKATQALQALLKAQDDESVKSLEKARLAVKKLATENERLRTEVSRAQIRPA